ncbi:hypothetical protein [Hankyongella ginsenosidimutans]|uniref:hypothetical protein n=1 Tax=Hankyongella ginsenosidimutans TaxID=1763828 RepID=UPI001FE422BC|nr:hypothetical protein [Hankyongella ginsenosidimutans]
MTLIGRSDQSLIGRWFWTIDRFLLLLLALLIGIGVVAMLSASPRRRCAIPATASACRTSSISTATWAGSPSACRCCLAFPCCRPAGCADCVCWGCRSCCCCCWRCR